MIPKGFILPNYQSVQGEARKQAGECSKYRATAGEMDWLGEQVQTLIKHGRTGVALIKKDGGGGKRLELRE